MPQFNIIYEDLMNQLNKHYDCQNITIVALPGSFKPPHKGHWEMIMKYYNMPQVQQINVFISNISTKIISNNLLSKSNLNPLFKIITKFNKEKQKYNNQLLVHKLNMCFEQIQSKVDNLTFNLLKRYINSLIETFNEVKTSQFDQLIDKLYNYLNQLESKLFNNIRKADGNIQIEPQISKKILDMYVKTYGVENKVKIWQPRNPSPMMSVTGFVNHACNNCTVLLGSSKKDNDDVRWEQYLKSFQPNNKIIPMPVTVETNINASTIRQNIHNLKKEWFPDKLSDEQFEQLKHLLLNK